MTTATTYREPPYAPNTEGNYCYYHPCFTEENRAPGGYVTSSRSQS